MGFKKLDNEDFIISSDAITSTVWSNNEPNLTSFFTSSIQINSNVGKYYNTVYNYATSNSSSEPQFHIAYCDINGSSSELYNPLVTGSSPSRTNFEQYKNLILGDNNMNFIFGNYSASSFLVLNIERARYKEKLLPGTLTLNLMNSGSQLKLTDDSVSTSTINYQSAGRVFNLISGSSGTAYIGQNSNGWAGGPTSASGSYGWFLPDVGLLLLNTKALEGSAANGGINLPISRSFNVNDNNPLVLYNAFVSSSAVGDGFVLNSEETISSNYVFIRARNQEFNYSENPSFISGSTGVVAFDSFVTSPKTYITTVGLYNDNNDLLAIGKLSRPLQKDFVKELLIRMKLDF